MSTQRDTLAVIEEPETTTALATMENAPTAVLAEAQKAAAALQDVISRKPNPVLMNGQQYLEFEDWQTLGRFYGITAREDGDPEFVSLGTVEGFKASAVAVDRTGRELSRATAYCLNDEEKWSTRAKYAWVYVCKDGTMSVEDPGFEKITWEPNPSKPGKNRPVKRRELVGEEKVPLFQLASMAQTRAAAKALRNVLSWVAVLAGYKPTPAEELDELIARGQAPAAETVDAEPVSGLAPEAERVAAAGAEPNPAFDPNARRDPPRPPARVPAVLCPHCGKPAKPSKYPKAGATYYCYECKHPFDPEREQ
jgi:hypothetical protein